MSGIIQQHSSQWNYMNWTMIVTMMLTNNGSLSLPKRYYYYLLRYSFAMTCRAHDVAQSLGDNEDLTVSEKLMMKLWNQFV
jgi:hypothetical protein